MNGIDVLLAAAALAILLATERYTSWRRWDHYRRLQRRAHRNLQRHIR